jgi:TonB family protein
LIRHFYEGPLLRYDDSLQAIRAPEGTWTVSGYVEIKKIQVKDGSVVIEGGRLAAIYDEKQHNMRLARYDEPVIIKLTAGSDDDARKKVAQIFVGNSDDIAALVPSYWRHYAETHEITDLSKRPKQALATPPQSNDDVHTIGGGISPPRPTQHPEPSVTPFARRFRIQGNTALSLTVDENGEPQDISIVKPLGAGFDEAAVEAVKQWRFEPARKSGQPIKVRVVVEISYHL